MLAATSTTMAQPRPPRWQQGLGRKQAERGQPLWATARARPVNRPLPLEMAPGRSKRTIRLLAYLPPQMAARQSPWAPIPLPQAKHQPLRDIHPKRRPSGRKPMVLMPKPPMDGPLPSDPMPLPQATTAYRSGVQLPAERVQLQWVATSALEAWKQRHQQMTRLPLAEVRLLTRQGQLR